MLNVMLTMFCWSAFTSYGAFWMSYATIFIPGSGIITAYGDNVDELHQALGIYLITWFMFTFLLMCVALSFGFYVASNAYLIGLGRYAVTSASLRSSSSCASPLRFSQPASGQTRSMLQRLVADSVSSPP
jgi:hypothetical protein